MSNPCCGQNEYWCPYNNPFGWPKMSTGGPLVCLFGPYFFQNEYSKPLPGPKFEYWPFETIPLDIIMRVFTIATTYCVNKFTKIRGQKCKRVRYRKKHENRPTF